MSHMNLKHLNKSNDELIYRILTEWKSNVGCFYYDMTNKFEDSLCTETILSAEEYICIYKFEKPIGHGFNRKLQEIETCFARVVYDSKGDIITAYPELELGYIINDTYEINTEGLILTAENNGDVTKHFQSKSWDFFLRLKKDLDLEIRFISNKKNLQIRIYFKNFTIKINKDYDLRIYDNGVLITCESRVCNLYDYIVNFVK